MGKVTIKGSGTFNGMNVFEHDEGFLLLIELPYSEDMVRKLAKLHQGPIVPVEFTIKGLA